MFYTIQSKKHKKVGFVEKIDKEEIDIIFLKNHIYRIEDFRFFVFSKKLRKKVIYRFDIRRLKYCKLNGNDLCLWFNVTFVEKFFKSLIHPEYVCFKIDKYFSKILKESENLENKLKEIFK
jgi:hypothetical protein